MSNKKNGMFDFDNAVETGEITVDMIMAAIKFYRNQLRIVDTIYLNEWHWGIFLEWVHSNGGETEGIDFNFDGVNIKKQIVSTGEPMDITFYTEDSHLDELPTDRSKLKKRK